jgi:hypothetical protein
MNAAFTAWWGTLDGALRVFYGIGLVSALVLFIQMVMLLFGFDGDGDGGDGDVSAAEAGDASVLSVRTITAFFVGFGWTGVAMLKGGSSVPVATMMGLFVGGVFMAVVFALMKLLYSMRASGTVDFHNAVGEIGQVYVTVGPGMEKAGQVEVMVQGRLRTVTALTHAARPLAARTRVRVVGVVDESTLLIEPLES